MPELLGCAVGSLHRQLMQPDHVRRHAAGQEGTVLLGVFEDAIHRLFQIPGHPLLCCDLAAGGMPDRLVRNHLDLA